jgi:hypothetical protein
LVVFCPECAEREFRLGAFDPVAQL